MADQATIEQEYEKQRPTDPLQQNIFYTYTARRSDEFERVHGHQPLRRYVLYIKMFADKRGEINRRKK
jgi:hypothetical protein